MGVHTIRLPENLENYVKMVISAGYATSYGNAINLIVLDKMMSDKKAGNIRPFKYKLIDARIKTGVDLERIGTENVNPSDALHIEGSAPDAPGANAGISQPSKPKEIKAVKCKSCGRIREVLEMDGIPYYACPCGQTEPLMKGAATFYVPEDYKFDNSKPKAKAPGYFRSATKPVYPGTLAEYNKAIESNEITPGQFEPPAE